VVTALLVVALGGRGCGGHGQCAVRGYPPHQAQYFERDLSRQIALGGEKMILPVAGAC